MRPLTSRKRRSRPLMRLCSAWACVRSRRLIERADALGQPFMIEGGAIVFHDRHGYRAFERQQIDIVTVPEIGAAIPRRDWIPQPVAAAMRCSGIARPVGARPSRSSNRAPGLPQVRRTGCRDGVRSRPQRHGSARCARSRRGWSSGLRARACRLHLSAAESGGPRTDQCLRVAGRMQLSRTRFQPGRDLPNRAA